MVKPDMATRHQVPADEWSTAGRNPASSGMITLAAVDAWCLRLSDRLDPMLVRCVRQDLRSKVFTGVFSLLLLISAILSLVIAANAATATDQNARHGQYLFLGLGWCWSFALVVVQGIATHRLVAQERNDDTWDLVELTGLPPRRIIRGLLLASLTQSALYTAAMAPFLVMAYLLRGLDLLTIAASLIAVPMLGVVAAVVGLLLACAIPNRKARAAGGAIVGLALLVGWSFASTFIFTDSRFGLNSILRELADGNSWAWAGIGMTINAWHAVTWLGLVLATTLLLHRANNRSSGPRVAVLLVWLNAVAWAIGVALIGNLDERERGQLFTILAFFGTMGLLISGIFALTEDAALSPRQAREIAEAHGWRRRAMVFLGPGAARARWFMMVGALLILPLILCGFADTSGGYRSDQSQHAARAVWFMFGYGTLVLLVSDALARGPLARWCPAPMQRRIVVFVVAACWSVLPPLVALLANYEGGLYAAMRLLTPGWAVVHYADDGQAEPLVGILIALPVMMLLVLAWQGRRLALVTQRVTAVAEDRNPRA